MKTKFLLLTLMMVGLTAFASCDDDDDDRRVIVTETVEKAFQTKFPNATRVLWEYKHGYYVADFMDNGVEVDAWFSPAAEWKMTETDVRSVDNLPEAVKKAFTEGQYASWTVDDIDKYERSDTTFFLIEVEKRGEKDRNLYYAPDGIIIKDVEDTPNDVVLPDSKL